MCELFEMAEDLDMKDEIHLIFNIMKTVGKYSLVSSLF